LTRRTFAFAICALVALTIEGDTQPEPGPINVGLAKDDPIPNPEPDPGDLPADDPPIVLPPIPISGPVGPGYVPPGPTGQG